LIEDKKRIGVCIDTCHSYAAGYDIKTQEGFRRTFEKFDEIIGFHYLKGIHLNDAKKGLGSRVDRHDSLGKGLLGIEAFRHLMNDDRFDDLPIILETPDEDLWPGEIKLLYGL
jgi:deoxyribonuclease-4